MSFLIIISYISENWQFAFCIWGLLTRHTFSRSLSSSRWFKASQPWTKTLLKLTLGESPTYDFQLQQHLAMSFYSNDVSNLLPPKTFMIPGNGVGSGWWLQDLRTIKWFRPLFESCWVGKWVLFLLCAQRVDQNKEAKHSLSRCLRSGLDSRVVSKINLDYHTPHALSW